MTGDVFPGTLGWVNDGPFFLYLQGEGFGNVLTEGYGGAKTDIPLGELTLGKRIQALNVSAVITIPENTPPGEYWVTACNEPCTTGLGDLIGAVLYVGIDPPDGETSSPPVTTTTVTSAIATVATPTTQPATDKPPVPRQLKLAPYPDRPDPLSPIGVGISAALAGAVLVTALLMRQRT